MTAEFKLSLSFRCDIGARKTSFLVVGESKTLDFNDLRKKPLKNLRAAVEK
jgi:hypothetical protein